MTGYRSNTMTTRLCAGLLGLALAASLPQSSSAATFRGASCPSADVDARVTRVARPIRPTIAVAQNATGTTIVEVKLSASGSVAAVHVVETSGNKWLDREALDAARQSTYAPALR